MTDNQHVGGGGMVPVSQSILADAFPPEKRNVGGSIGVSLAANVLAHREQFHQSRLIEQVTSPSVQYQQTMQQVIQYFVEHGSSLVQAQRQAFAWIAQQVQTQATYLAYIDVFWTLMLISAAAVPLALILRRSSSGAIGPVRH